MRDKLYLAALLHHIDVLKDEFDALNNDEIQEYLDKADEYATASTSFSRGDLKRVASPFETLKKYKQGNDRTFVYGYQPLNLSEGFFPKEGTNVNDTHTRIELWDKFANAFRDLKKNKLEGKALAETTLHLLHKYAVALPNPSNIHPEVSFYDYAKIKAGLAVCIYDYKKAQEENKSENPLLIIRADISGIQEFIGSIASKNASKNLKGRSFYVQLLVDTVLKLMLKKLKLYEGNVMYASGGNFFVIAPNTKQVQVDFEQFEKEITAAIFEEHQTRIAVVMGKQEVTHKQIVNGRIDEAIVALFEKVIDKKKKQKFKSLIVKDYTQFFEPSDIGGEVALDAITGEEVKPEKSEKYWVLEGSLPELKIKKADDDIVSEKTAKQIILGRQLKEARNWVVSESKISTDYETREAEVLALSTYRDSLYHYLLEDRKLKKLNLENKSYKNYKLNDIVKIDANQSFTLYGGNEVPRFELPYKEDIFYEKKQITEPKLYEVGQPKEFSHLSIKFKKKDGQLVKDKEGYFETEKFKRLSVLKMDIDGLGSIFKTFVPYPEYHELKEEGTKEEITGKRRKNLSFSYYAALSRNLDWFFKGYLNTLWAGNEDFKNYSQIIYSGGDDLFIIGRWDVIVEFSKRIKEQFAAFTLSNNVNEWQQKVTISGGMSIVTHKFPIMKAAAFAGDAEHRAKGHELNKEKEPTQYDKVIYKKNSVDLLGVSLHWETEFKLVEKLKNKLVERIGGDKKNIPKSILDKIQIHATSASIYKKSKEAYDKLSEKERLTKVAPSPRYIWTSIYDFSKLEKSVSDETKIGKENKKHIKALSSAIFTNKWDGEKIQSKYNFLKLLSIAARWAELTIRNKS